MAVQTPQEPPSPPEYLVMLLMTHEKMLDAKPKDRSDLDRKFAIAITDLEKLIAFATVYLS